MHFCVFLKGSSSSHFLGFRRHIYISIPCILALTNTLHLPKFSIFGAPMGLPPKTKHGSDPLLDSGDSRPRRNFKKMSISELVSQLRDTFFSDDFDQVEEILVAREAKFMAEIAEKMREIGSLQSKVEIEKLKKIKFEEEMKKYKKLYEEGRAEIESLKTNFRALNERVSSLEKNADPKFLMNGDDLDGGNNQGESVADHEVTSGAQGVKDIMGMDDRVRGLKFRSNTAGTGTEMKGSDEHNCISRGSLHRKEATSPIIADNKHPSSSGAVQQNKHPTRVAEAIGIHRKGVASSSELVADINNILDGLDADSDTSSSSSYSDSFDVDRVPLNIFVSDKKRKA